MHSLIGIITTECTNRPYYYRKRKSILLLLIPNAPIGTPTSVIGHFADVILFQYAAYPNPYFHFCLNRRQASAAIWRQTPHVHFTRSLRRETCIYVPPTASIDRSSLRNQKVLEPGIKSPVLKPAVVYSTITTRTATTAVREAARAKT